MRTTDYTRYVTAALQSCLDDSYARIAATLVRVAAEDDADLRLIALVEELARAGSYVYPEADRPA